MPQITTIVLGYTYSSMVKCEKQGRFSLLINTTRRSGSWNEKFAVDKCRSGLMEGTWEAI
jgi:hypothetical protein